MTDQDYIHLIQALHSKYDGSMIRVGFGPLAPQWCTKDLLIAIREAADRLDIPIHTHALETVLQKRFGSAKLNRTLIEYMNEFNDTKQKFSVPHMKSNGMVVSCQDEREASGLSAYDWRKRVVFKGKLEPSSMNRFDLTLEALDEKPKLPVYEKDGLIKVRTEDLDISISTGTGLISEMSVRGIKCLENAALQ